MQFKRVKKILNLHRKRLSRLGVRALALFGSVARDKATSKSDIDILIEFDSKKDLFDFVSLKSYLEDLLDCRVDLVIKSALHPALKERILREARYVF